MAVVGNLRTQVVRARVATGTGLASAVRSGTAQVAVLAIVVKLLLLLFAWIAYILVPQEQRVSPTDPHLPIDWLRIWSQWDVGGFLPVAEHGYIPEEPITAAFFPLLPVLIRFFTPATGNAFLAGLLLSNVLMVVAAVLLYQLALLRLKDEGVAFRTAFYALIFPAAFYTSTAYSESLYLVLTVASFYLMERRRWIWSGIAGALVAATRSLGVIIVAPLALGYALDALRRRRLDLGISVVPLTVAGLGIVMVILWDQTGNPLGFMSGYQAWGRSGLPNPAAALWQGWEVLNWKHIVPGFESNYGTNALNWGSSVLFLILGVVALRTVGLTYGVYTLVAVLVGISFTPLGDRPAAGMLRYTHVLFPGLMVLAQWGRHRVVDGLITALFLLFLGLLSGLFVRSWNVPGVS